MKKNKILVYGIILIIILLLNAVGAFWKIRTSVFFYSLTTKHDRSLANQVFDKSLKYKKENGINPSISDIYFDGLEYFDAYDHQVNKKCDAAGWGCKRIDVSTSDIKDEFTIVYIHDLYECRRSESSPEWTCYWND